MKPGCVPRTEDMPLPKGQKRCWQIMILPWLADLLGATSLKTRTASSNDHQQLIEAHQIKTKQAKEGQLIIKRYLIDEGKTLWPLTL